MILIDKMKDGKIYRQPTFLPTEVKDKKKGSAILMLSPNFESSKRLMSSPLFINKRRYSSYYMERDVSFYIGSNKVEDVEESAILEAEYMEEAKRSELPDSAFGVPSKRKFPLDTEAHVRSAIKFFNYVDPEDEKELARRIIAAMKKFNITDVKVGEKNRFSKYYKPIDESGLPNIIIPKYLYHGACQYYDKLLATSIDLGNKFQDPGWSLYTWTKYDFAVGWAIFSTIKDKIYKYIDYKPLGCKGSHISVLSTKNYEELIAKLDNIPEEDKTAYVYTIDSRQNSNFEFGLGHSSNTPNCITIRTNDDVKITKVDSYIINKELIDKYCIVTDKEFTNTEYGMNSRLLSFLMTNDMMYNAKIKKALSKAIKSGELQVGDDIYSYMKEHGLEFESVSFIKRIKDKITNESYTEEASDIPSNVYTNIKDIKNNPNMIIIGEIHDRKMIKFWDEALAKYKPEYWICEFADEDECLTDEVLQDRMNNATNGSYESDGKNADYQYNYWCYDLALKHHVKLIGCNKINTGKHKSMESEDKAREPFMLQRIKKYSSKKALVQLGDHHLRSIPISKEFLEYCGDEKDDRGIVSDLKVSFASPVWEYFKNKNNVAIVRVKSEYNNELKFSSKSIDESINEGYIINEPDILYNKDKFDSGEINLCFITGHSGSGKSTLGRNLQSDTVEHYELDDIQCTADHFTMDNLKEYGDLIYSYFKGPGKQFYVTYDELAKKKIPGSEYEDKLFPGFVHYAMEYAKKHKDRKYVIEGVWLFCNGENKQPWFRPEEFKDYAFYIKGTSALISKYRAAKRDAKDADNKKEEYRAFAKNFFLKNWKWYLIDEKRVNIFRNYFKKLTPVDESYIEESMSTNYLLSVLPESALDLGDKVMFFNEADDKLYNAQLKRLLFSKRIKNRKELLTHIETIRKDLADMGIKFIFPELKRYIKKNVYVDLSYYTTIFFENNTWVQKKGLKLYTDFMNKLLNHPGLSANGYTKKTVFIPVLDWVKTKDPNFWNYRKYLSPISVIYQMMYEGKIYDLKKSFGTSDVLFIGSNNYFKFNFSTVDPKELKKLANKFKLFIKKMVNNEEFELDDIDTSAENSDSKEVIQNKLIDKVELARGVDLTAKVAAANKKVEDEKAIKDKLAKANTIVKYSTNAKEIEKAKADVAKLKASVKKDTKLDSITKQDTKTKEELEKQKEERKKDIENSNKSKLSKAQEDEDNDLDIGSIPDTAEDDIAYAIAKAAEDNDTEEEALDDLDTEEMKRMLLSISGEDQVDISPTRAARLDKLNKELLDKEINGKSIKEILEDDSNKEEIKSNFDVASPNVDEWQGMSFVNFDKNYDIDKDIIKVLQHLSTCSRPIAVKDIKVTDTSTSEDRIHTYDVQFEDYRGARFSIKLDIPIMEDNRFRLRGNYYSIQTQFFNMPIVKTETDTCQLITNYNKLFLFRFGATGKATPITGRIIKAANKYKGTKIKFTTGYNAKVSDRYQLPMDYIDLSLSFTYIDTPYMKIYFDQEEIRQKYTIEPNKGIPFAYHKKENAVLYFGNKDESDNFTFDKLLLDILMNADPEFTEVFNASTRPTVAAYSRIKIMSTLIPLCLVVGYSYGLTEVLRRLGVEYRLEKSLSKEDRINPNLDWIKFSDGYIIYEQNYSSNLLLNGIKKCSTDMFSINDIDNRNMYLEFLDDFGGRIKADGLDNFKDLFIDPMIVSSLEYYKLPKDYLDMLLYANSLLADNKFTKYGDTSSRKLRRYEIIAAYVYKVISGAYGKYTYSVKHTPNNVTFDVKRSSVIDMFLTDKITSPDSCINALRDVETTNAVTAKGPSGMNSDRAYSLDARSYDESMVNILGMSTGFSGNVGITRQTSMNPNITPDGYTVGNNGNLDTMNDANTLTATENLAPFSANHDDPMRLAMTFIQTAKHSVRTEVSDPLLVTNGADEVMPYMTTDKFAFKAKKNGKVIDLTEEYILIEYEDGTKDFVDLRENIEHNSDGGYYVPLKLDPVKGLKIGSKVKPEQVVAYDSYSFSNSLGESDNLAYNIGTLAKVAIINSDEGFEDSGVISESMAHNLATKIIYCFSAVVNKDSKIFKIAKVGDHIEAADTLLLWEDMFDDEDTSDLMNSLANSDTDFSELGKKKLEAEITGELKDIKIYRTVEIEDLSESVAKVVKAYEAPIKKLAKIAKDNGISKDKIPATYTLPPTGKLKKAQEAIYIEFYVEHLDTVGVGDKIVYNAANKAVIKNVIPDNEFAFSEARPNEPLSGFISETSISKRLVCSSLVMGSINKLMVELDRHVKDIMGIKWDDSEI